MKTIRTTNLRSIVDSGNIGINKINILLGANSSGKSTFVRMFPMFTESSKHELRGPLLWADEDYDYGSFKKALYNKANEEHHTISFSFCWDLKYDKKRKDFFPYLKDSNEITLTITIGEETNADKKTSVIIKELMVFAKQLDLKLITGNTSSKSSISCYLNGEKVDIGEANWEYEVKGVLPNIRIRVPNHDSEFQKLLQLQQRYNEYNHGKNIDFLNLISVSEFSLSAIKQEIQDKLTGYLGTQKTNKNIETLTQLIFPSLLMSLLSYCDQYITYYFRHCFYITPLRYSTKRYTTDNEFAVNQVDPSGKNLVNFIASLNKEELDKLNKFLEATIQTNISIEGQMHTELQVKMKDSLTYNIVDVGYGYTQLLPIAVQLWDVARTQSETENTIIIEQPEVHLHPKLQSNLAHLFVYTLEYAKKNKIDIRFIIETHSGYLVNRLGKYVYLNSIKENVEPQMHKLSPDDITIYLFNKEEGVTQIGSTKFDEDGAIINWPIGFLD